MDSPHGDIYRSGGSSSGAARVVACVRHGTWIVRGGPKGETCGGRELVMGVGMLDVIPPFFFFFITGMGLKRIRGREEWLQGVCVAWLEWESGPWRTSFSLKM